MLVFSQFRPLTQVTLETSEELGTSLEVVVRPISTANRRCR